MPDRDPEAPPNARLLTALIWAGVGLAPVAALVVLLGGSDNSVRFAVLLIAVSVVLIGAALLVRHDPVLLGMGVEDQIEALREELREEITASAHAAGNRVRALQDEMTRMRAAGSPARGLPPAAARSASPVAEFGYQGNGRASATVPEAGRNTGGRAAPAPTGRPAVASASVAPPGGHGASVAPSGGHLASVSPAGGQGASVAPPGGRTAVARIPAVAAAAAPVTGSASVGSAAVRPAAVSAAPGSAAASPVPRQRVAAAAPPTSDGYQGGFSPDGGGDDAAGAQAFGGYGPGLSGSAWAERSGATDYPAGGYGAADAAPPDEQRPSRRHAAPDTGTDLARYGLGSPAVARAQSYGTPAPPQSHDGPAAPQTYGAATPQSYGGAAAPQTYGAPNSQTYGAPTSRSYGAAPAPQTYGGAEYGFDQTGGYDYADPAAHEQPARSAYGIETSSFFADDDPEDPAPGSGYSHPGRGDTHAEEPPGYGPDPLAPQHGWAPRDREHPGRRW